MAGDEIGENYKRGISLTLARRRGPPRWVPGVHQWRSRAPDIVFLIRYSISIALYQAIAR